MHQHHEGRACICDRCSEERKAVYEANREYALEILGDRYKMHPSNRINRQDHTPSVCQCNTFERQAAVKRALAGYAEHRDG